MLPAHVALISTASSPSAASKDPGGSPSAAGKLSGATAALDSRRKLKLDAIPLVSTEGDVRFGATTYSTPAPNAAPTNRIVIDLKTMTAP
jgi:hypothetical protein